MSSLVVTGLTSKMCRFLVHHLDVAIQGVLVHSCVLAHVALKSPLLQVHSRDMPLESKFICCGIFADRALVPNLAGSLVPVGNVSFQS